jgi:hypothetical protein
MAKYIVTMCEETVFKYEVEADTAEEAEEIVEYDPTNGAIEVDCIPIERYCVESKLLKEAYELESESE